MAIEIEWQVKPKDRGNEDITPRMFPRMVKSEIIDEQTLAGIMSNQSQYTRGAVANILEDLSETMAALLREGRTIRIPSLGTFSLSIGTDGEVTASTAPSARKALAKGVNFRPCEELKNSVSTASFRTVARNAATIAPSARSLVPALTEYFKTRDSITRAEFASLFKLKRTTAYLRLKELTDMGIVKNSGNNQRTKYVKGDFPTTYQDKTSHRKWQ